jgi:hypothetical protein
MKRIEIDDKFYRVRREVMVEIPMEWVGKITTQGTIRKRGSKIPHKLSRATKWRRERLGSTGGRYIKYMDDKLNYDEDLYL